MGLASSCIGGLVLWVDVCPIGCQSRKGAKRGDAQDGWPRSHDDWNSQQCQQAPLSSEHVKNGALSQRSCLSSQGQRPPAAARRASPSVDGVKFFQDASSGIARHPGGGFFTAPTHSMAIPLKLQQSYSTSDIPTMKTGNVNLDANNHALVALADDRERHPGRRRLGLERRRGREQGGCSSGDATLKRQSILDDVIEDEPWKTVCRRHTWRGDGPGTVEGPSCPARGEETESCQAFTGPRKATGTATWPLFVVAIAAESRIQNTQSLQWAPFDERSLRGWRNVISFNRAASNSPAQPSPVSIFLTKPASSRPH